MTFASKAAIDNIVKHVSVRMGVKFTNHVLRWTHGRTLWLAGAPIETIAELMGHRDIHTTIDYLGIDLQDKVDAMNRLK